MDNRGNVLSNFCIKSVHYSRFCMFNGIACQLAIMASVNSVNRCISSLYT